MALASSFDGVEILQIAESVAREKSISRESILIALEDTIKNIAKRQYGNNNSLKVHIDRRLGEIKVYNELNVVDDEEINEQDDISETNEKQRIVGVISVTEAQKYDPGAVAGDCIREQLPPLHFDRVSAQAAKTMILSKVREIELIKQSEEYKDRIGEIVSGVVEDMDRGNITVRLGSGEACIERQHLLRSDHFKKGDRIRACLIDIKQDIKGPQLVLSRTDDQFLAQLLALEVPEIYNKVIEIIKVVRDPGSRAKVAVYSSDTSIDPIGSCIGVKGSRIKSIINELGGEKVDVVQWSNDCVQATINALYPVQVQKIFLDEDEHKIEVVVNDANLSIAIGRRGQNVKLISKLIGWGITIVAESVEAVKRNEEFGKLTKFFVAALDIEELLAQLLISEGYDSVLSLANANVNSMASIEGFDEEVANELISRAREYSELHSTNGDIADGKAEVETSASKSLLDFASSSGAIFKALMMAGVKTQKDLADLATDELIAILDDFDVAIEHANAAKIIERARQAVYFGLSPSSDSKNNAEKDEKANAEKANLFLHNDRRS